MKFCKNISCYLLLCFSVYSYGQNIKQQQWKQRILLILTNDEHSVEYKRQLNEFNDTTLDFKERKLMVFRVTPNSYRIGFDETKKKASTELFKKYKKNKESVEVILIGLDGGVKLRKTSLLRKTALFALIDGMPMRKSELKNKN